MPNTLSSHERRQNGFSLIEVLVAMLVLASGLLGLAALQTQGVRFNHDAYVRTNATNLATDIVDKMRLNRTQLIDTTLAEPAVYATANFPPRDNVPPFSVTNPPYLCTADATPTADLKCWLNGIELGLPLGRATIAVQGVPITTINQPNRDLYDISILWLDREPRDFGGTSRLAQSSAECLATINRIWVAPRCFVTQTWTVWP